jgi:hypothetical protein
MKTRLMVGGALGGAALVLAGWWLGRSHAAVSSEVPVTRLTPVLGTWTVPLGGAYVSTAEPLWDPEHDPGSIYLAGGTVCDVIERTPFLQGPSIAEATDQILKIRVQSTGQVGWALVPRREVSWTT